MPKIMSGGLTLYYERKAPEGANALPLLVISGTGNDLRKKPNVMDGPLAKHFDVVAYDQRGLGQSDKPTPPYSMADYADDAANLMEALGWESARVLGISFGGMVAQELAIRHATRIDRLVLACTSPGGVGGASYPLHDVAHMDPVDRASFMIPISDRRHDAAWQAAHPQAFDAMIAMSVADPYADEPMHREGLAAQLAARAGHDTWERLGEIKAPTLICGGKYDGIATPETQTRLQSRILGAELQMFEGGHLFMIQDRAAFAAMISFLQN